MPQKKPLSVAVLQFNAGPDVERNLHLIERQCRNLPAATDLLALPETSAARGPAAVLQAAAERLPGPITRRLMEMAAEHGIWIMAGSIVERGRNGQLHNTSLLLDRRGQLVARYRKRHLYEAQLGGRHVRESDNYTPGTCSVMAAIEGWRCGLAICYDIRFPAIFSNYARQGVDLHFIPSDFGWITGQAHWETLARARAIETQTFLVAPNQCGAHSPAATVSHGHSLIVNPWGEILAQAGTRPELLTATLDPAALREARNRLPDIARHLRRKP